MRPPGEKEKQAGGRMCVVGRCWVDGRLDSAAGDAVPGTILGAVFGGVFRMFAIFIGESKGRRVVDSYRVVKVVREIDWTRRTMLCPFARMYQR